MSKGFWYIWAFVFIHLSCDNFKFVKKLDREKVFKEKLSDIDHAEIEKPPLFVPCRNEPEESKTCFQNTIIKHISTYLTEHQIQVTTPINDTIWVPLIITKDKEIILEDFVIPEIISSQIPDFKNILKNSLETLPDVDPAIARSIPVTSKYKLPIVILMN